MGYEDQRRARNGQWGESTHSAADFTLMLEEPLFDISRLTPKKWALLQDHLADTDPATGLTYDELYDEYEPESVSRDLTWVRRGAPRELRWHLNRAGAEPLHIPDFVAAAVTVPDVSDPLAPLEHARDKAHRAWQRTVEDRTRRIRRITAEERQTAADKENTAYGKYLLAAADHATRKAELGLKLYRDLTSGDSSTREDEWEAAAQAAGMTLPPLEARVEQARRVAARLTEEAQEARGKVRGFNAPPTVKRRESGHIIQL